MAKADCKQCAGTGWVTGERDGVSSAIRCSCVAESRAEELEAQSQIPENYRHASFETFHLPHDNPTAQKTLADVMLAVSAYTRAYPDNNKPGLLLVGPPGTGKTHLAVAALRLLLARGYEGIFFDYQNLLERIRAGYSETLGSSSREAYRFALEIEILLLDDLGAHRVTDWVEDTVTSIVTYRCNHRKPLIATTNLTDPDIGGTLLEKTSLPGGHAYRTTLEERVGERARSRLFEMCRVIRMPNVADYRIRPHRHY
ncbi:MAG: ATP-binding protein [Acidobacteriaceae bacterium]|nr:ATP-binding protein [Acidobacteriaceae bacterium]MBV8569191.1 ATP-binding protein [Acidobacteriaceae bacterium]